MNYLFQVVDMFGSGVPACAIHFKCIHELVKHNENGIVFKDENNELANHLARLFKKFPCLVGGSSTDDKRGGDMGELARLKSGVKATVRWEENWSLVALPLLSRTLSKERIPDALLVLLVSFGVCFWGWVYAAYFQQ
jgi:beta-1,4-mannosyltransferase